MSRIINAVAVLGMMVLLLSILVSMRGTFPASFRLVELAAAITVLVAVIANMVVHAKERRDRS